MGRIRESLTRLLGDAGKPGAQARLYEMLKLAQIRLRCLCARSAQSVEGTALRVGFVIPGCTISGGLSMAFAYANALRRSGMNVSMLCTGEISSTDWFKDQKVKVFPIDSAPAGFDVLISTAWNTDLYLNHLHAKRKIYLVQADERCFYEPGSAMHRMVERTYRGSTREIIVIAGWMKRWLKEEFGLESTVIQNGIRFSEQYARVRPLEARGEKLRILIEGDPASALKNVAEAFEIAGQIEDAEIWHVNPAGGREMGAQRTFSRVPHADMPAIYASCDVLVKTSRQESYCLPALEMMACGGAVVAFETNGVREFIKDGENGFILRQGDRPGAVRIIRMLKENPHERARIQENARRDAAGYELEDGLRRFVQLVHGEMP